MAYPRQPQYSSLSHYILVWPRVIGRSFAISQSRRLLPYDLNHSSPRFVPLYVETEDAEVAEFG